MFKNLTPSPANGPLRPEDDNNLAREVVKLVNKMLDKLNETAFVVVSAFIFKGSSDFMLGYQVTTDVITMLGSYLTLRLFELRNKP